MILFLAFGAPNVLLAQPSGSNIPPLVTITSPPYPFNLFSLGTFLRISADAIDPDGSISSVQFYADTNLIGVVTNPPFSIIWPMESKGTDIGQWMLKARAFDDLGAMTESVALPVFYCSRCPQRAVLAITSPENGSWFAAPANFDFRAMLVASLGDAGPVEFFVGTNSVGTVSQIEPFNAALPPYKLTVTNLSEGDYQLTARYLGEGGSVGPGRTIHVTKLALLFPRLTLNGQLEFQVVTSFPDRQTVIEASPNLVKWNPIFTNVPSSNTFNFTEPSGATNSLKFYRARVPPA
jgi:hypothetical protein